MARMAKDARLPLKFLDLVEDSPNLALKRLLQSAPAAFKAIESMDAIGDENLLHVLETLVTECEYIKAAAYKVADGLAKRAIRREKEEAEKAKRVA